MLKYSFLGCPVLFHQLTVPMLLVFLPQPDIVLIICYESPKATTLIVGILALVDVISPNDTADSFEPFILIQLSSINVGLLDDQILGEVDGRVLVDLVHAQGSQLPPSLVVVTRFVQLGELGDAWGFGEDVDNLWNLRFKPLHLLLLLLGFDSPVLELVHVDLVLNLVSRVDL